MEYGSIVFLRLNLLGDAGRQRVSRGSRGVVRKAKGRRPLWVQFDCGTVVACDEKWVEPTPGRIARELANQTCQDFYQRGMIITDVLYPSKTDVHFQRWENNARRAASAWPGVESWNAGSVDVMNMKVGLSKRGIDIDALGLVLCEQPNSPGDDQGDLQHRIIVSWLAQLKGGSALGVLVIRDWCASQLKMKLTKNFAEMPKRVSILDIDMHYEPIRNTDKFATADGWHVGGVATIWKAVVVRGGKPNFVEMPGRISIPTLVWHTAIYGKRTLQTACYTCESSVAISEFVQMQLTLYGLAQPGH
jgi:hypothetical protein